MGTSPVCTLFLSPRCQPVAGFVNMHCRPAALVQHIMIDLGTGNNNKINWAMNDKQEFIDIVETVGACLVRLEAVV
jgi:hypothetical protein